MWLNKLGSLFIFIGLIILLFIYSPVLLKEIDYQSKKNTYEDFLLVDDPDKLEEVKSQAEIEYRKTLLVPKSFDFSLVIPKIGVNEEVFPYIDSGNEEEYLPILKQGVAHAKGSSLPNQEGVVYLFAHSTDSFYNISTYNASFFLLNKLQEEDVIYIFYQNRKYTYAVEDKKAMDADQVGEFIVNELSEDKLVLQTCWPAGTTFKRLLVVANPSLTSD